MSTSTERSKRHRERLQLARAGDVAELLRELTPSVEQLVLLQPRQLDALKWLLLEASSVARPCNARRRLDAYFTPPAVATAVVERVHQLLPTRTPNAERRYQILEPSGGLGAFVRAAQAVWSLAEIATVDVRLRKQLRDLAPGVTLVHQDFLKFEPSSYGFGLFDLIIGNPPFRDAEAHVRHALELLRPGGHLAFVLRLGFSSSLERAEGLWAQPGLRYQATIAPRPSFIEGGTDLSEYALFIWQAGFTGSAELGKPIVWRERRSSAAPAELRGAA